MVLIGIDIGGTFTDLVCYTDGKCRTVKVATTPQDFSKGLLKALLSCGILPKKVDLISHGTTVATNAMIERKGARCGLITTMGFRDLLALRRGTRRYSYGTETSFDPLIPRDLRLEVEERSGPEGPIVPVVEKDVKAAAEHLWKEGVEVAVVSFLHATSAPENEIAAVKMLRKSFPHRTIVGGFEVCNEPSEFERTSTAVANAYVTPLMEDYLNGVNDRLKEIGCKAALKIVTSDGGLTSVEQGIKTAIRTALSGPAAGVGGAQYLCSCLGVESFVACDMGGTSFDACLVTGGSVVLTNRRDLDFGLPISIPTVDVSTLGAGGGSIARVDSWGGLEVGPDGMGSEPGPACYGRQNIHATVLDANLVLGRVGPELCFSGGIQKLDLIAAQKVVNERVARVMGVGLEEGALAIIENVEDKMAECIRLLAFEKRISLDKLVLVAYGGAGPLHATQIATELGIEKVLVPWRAGTFSAWGGLLAREQEVRSVRVGISLDEHGIDELRAIFLTQRRQAEQELALGEGLLQVTFEIEVCYLGQAKGIILRFENDSLELETIRAMFEKRYRAFGTLLKNYPLNILGVRTSVIREADYSFENLLKNGWKSGDGLPSGNRKVWFGKSFHDCSVYDRNLLKAGKEIFGPAVIEEDGTTVIIPPKTEAWADEIGILHLSV